LKGSQTDVCKKCVETADHLPMDQVRAKGRCKAAAEKTLALFEEAAQVEKVVSKPAADSVTDVSSQTASQQSVAAVEKDGKEAQASKQGAQVEKRVGKPAADSVTDVSSQIALQLQKSTAVVTSHGGARAKRKFQEHMEATE